MSDTSRARAEAWQTIRLQQISAATCFATVLAAGTDAPWPVDSIYPACLSSFFPSLCSANCTLEISGHRSSRAPCNSDLSLFVAAFALMRSCLNSVKLTLVPVFRECSCSDTGLQAQPLRAYQNTRLGLCDGSRQIPSFIFTLKSDMVTDITLQQGSNARLSLLHFKFRSIHRGSNQVSGRSGGIICVEERHLAARASTLAQSITLKVERGAMKHSAIVPQRQIILLPTHSNLKIMVVLKQIEEEVQHVLRLEGLLASRFSYDDR